MMCKTNYLEEAISTTTASKTTQGTTSFPVPEHVVPYTAEALEVESILDFACPEAYDVRCWSVRSLG